MSDVRWNLRQALARGAPPDRVLALTNDWLARQSAHDRFVTALCVSIDVRSGRAEIAGAGHLGPFVRRVSGAAEHVTLPPALALGILPGEVYQPIAIDLLPDRSVRLTISSRLSIYWIRRRARPRLAVP